MVPDPTSDWIPKETFLAYCGGKPERPARFYDKAVSKKNLMTPSFNWFAFLAIPAWMGYRKQWAMIGVYAAGLSLIFVLEDLFHFETPRAVFLGIMSAIAVLADGLLLTRANAIHGKLKKEGLDETAIAEKMKNGASGSFVTAIGGLVAFLAFTTAAIFLEVFLVGP